MVRNSKGKTILDFVSTIDSIDKVDNLRSKYDFPSAQEARAPLGNERANSPPRGRITVYDRFMHLGLRFLLYPLFEEIVQHYRTPLARFTPNLITFVLRFARDWYIVKRRLRAGVKKMVEAYGGSPEWKPDFVFVKAPEGDTVNIEGATRIPLEISVEEDQDERVTVTAAPQKKKKKRIVKLGDRAKSKKAKTDAPSKETTQPDIKTVPLATESIQKPVPEVGPSIVPPAAEKGKGPLEGEVIILPPQLFKGDKCGLDGLPSAAKETSRDLATARAERDEALFEVVTLEEKARQVQVKEAEIAEVQAKYNELDEKMKSFASLHISKEELHQWWLKRLDQDRPIKAKWFKQLLMKDSKKTMHEAMVKVLTRLSLEQLPLWGALTGAMTKMSSPVEIASFPGDVPVVLAKGPSEEDPIPEESWTVHRVHLMVLSEEQSREFSLYAMISRILRSHADVHSLETVAHLESDLLDAMRTHNVKVNQHLINEIKGLREEMQRREVQSLKDHSDSLTFEAEIHDELVTLEKENARLRARQQITVSPWFLEKHQVLARVQHMIMVRTRCFITAMDLLKERSREIELLTDYIPQLQNLLLDNNIDFEAFERPEEIVDPRTRSSREELLMRVHAQDTDIVDLKDKLNQCVNLLSLHGCKGIIHPSPDNPVREVLVIV
ncbi:OLC1v1014485C1 [Oldenlandia corymbosa var. corymbosa]|uniref:OLC1v1014485C1 n=1 Tax=Oldenlandia corymbosa var. corymbosa TaxID=529605 RepID=A0AAV1E0V7_OLDCO|nr:OLC1v1014485C1 [Oldenlandia corymbosa var. corymbosa]